MKYYVYSMLGSEKVRHAPPREETEAEVLVRQFTNDGFQAWKEPVREQVIQDPSHYFLGKW